MKARKLLFITSNRLGDAVLSTGLLAAALERFQPQEVTIACGPIPAPLYQGVPNLKEIISLDKKRKGRHWLDLWGKTAFTLWDVVIDLRNSVVSYAIPSLKTFRFTGSRANESKAVQLARVLGLQPVPYNKIWLTQAAKDAALNFIPEGTPVLALCPTANWDPKQWPADRFIETARKLIGSNETLKNARIAVFGAGNERDQSQPIINALAKDFLVIDLVGKTDPLQAAACLEKARLCLANDSGLMHIAAAMGAPTLGIFGPSNSVEYSPHGTRAALVRGAEFHGLENTPDPQQLMLAVSVDSVIAAAAKLL
jgi:lipopolysaccharide export system permease protein